MSKMMSALRVDGEYDAAAQAQGFQGTLSRRSRLQPLGRLTHLNSRAYDLRLAL
ncbi:MAG TPA: hypothetical protein VKQ11_22175 [Candidatus Sulfotelmatobacter sp.]|nr:hypothetical protein [Candidatus Sulfotelmatobacter sp.]